MRPSVKAILTASLLTVAACTSAVRIDPATEEQRIRELDRQLTEALNRRDVAATTAFYTSDAVLMPANMPRATGSAAVRATWAELFKQPVHVDLSPTRIDVARAGDYAFDIGTFRLREGGAQGTVVDEGKYLVVWRKVDGEWKIASDIFNSDRPMPEPAPAVVVVTESEQMQTLVGDASVAWRDLTSPGFAPGAKMAVIHGDPRSSGDFTMRLRFPDGYAIAPHWHPAGEHITVLGGTFHLGMGERASRESTTAYRPGDFAYMPAKSPHFAHTSGETTIQLHGVGPWQANFLKPAM